MKSYRIEELENRLLLSITTAEYGLITERFADYGLTESASDLHLIEVTDATADSLRSAVAEAGTTTQDDLIVVRLTSEDSIDFGNDPLVIDIAYSDYGALSLVGLTEDGLALSAADWLDSGDYLVKAGTFFNGSIYFSVEDSERSEEFTQESAAANGAVSAASSVIGLDDLRADERFADIDGSGYSIVILDTGINSDHEYFLDGSGNCRIVYQYDFANHDAVAEDTDGHGTNVASIAAGNGEYGGLAPGANLIVLKVFDDSGNGNFDAIEEALDWVAKNQETYNIVSVNMSLGTTQSYQSIPSERGLGIADEIETLADQGIIVAVSAGNEFYSNGSMEGLAYPAILSGTVAVGAVYSEDIGRASYANGAVDYSTGADRICSFSNRSSSLSMVMAPGGSMTGAGIESNTSLVTYSGTSQASPIIAGTAALAQQVANRYLGRSLTLDEFNALLEKTSDIIYDGDDEVDNVRNTGAAYYRVNVYAMAEAIYSISLGEDTFDSEDRREEETVATALASPTLAVTVTGSRTGKVTIGTSQNASRYELEIATNADFEDAQSFTLSRSGSYNVTGMTAGTVYYFRVKAISGSSFYQDSAWSETVSATAGNSGGTSETRQLSAPTILVAQASGESSIALRFRTVANASGYTLEYSTDAQFSADATQTMTVASRSQTTISGLASGTTYYLRMKANGTGNYSDSEWSAVVTVQTDTPQTPEEPVNPEEPTNPEDPAAPENPEDPGDPESQTTLDAPKIAACSATSSSAAQFSFEAVEGASAYVLEISTSADFANATTKTLRQAGSYNITGLTAQTTYFIRIKAVASASGETESSDWSETAEFTTLAESTSQFPWESFFGGNNRYDSWFRRFF